MSPDHPFETITQSVEQTRQLGRSLGRLLKTGTILRLNGHLGSGKTSFVQGLALGLDVPEAYPITSPSYTLINEYPGRLPLIHVDLYRLAGPEDADAIGLWEHFGRSAVVAVEWADRLDDCHWPENALSLDFRIREDDSRSICLNGYGLERDNLIRDIVAAWRQIAGIAVTHGNKEHFDKWR